MDNIEFKEIKDKAQSGYLATMKMSVEDLMENDLWICFGTDRMGKPNLIKRGKFFSFVNNSVILSMYEKKAEFSIPSMKDPHVDIVGETDTFVVVSQFIPKQLDTERDPKKLDFSASPLGETDKTDSLENPGWEFRRGYNTDN